MSGLANGLPGGLTYPRRQSVVAAVLHPLSVQLSVRLCRPFLPGTGGLPEGLHLWGEGHVSNWTLYPM